MNCHPDWRLFLLAVGTSLLTACATLGIQGPAAVGSEDIRPCVEEAPAAEAAVLFESIEKLMDSDRPRAALAHVDALENGLGRTGRSMYLRAEALRKVGSLEAAAGIYRDLLDSCYYANAHYGLGLIAGEQGRWDEAEESLLQARRLSPTSSRINNDLGYAQLHTGAYLAAIESFRTALELDAGNTFSASNLVLALIMADERASAERYATKFGIDEPKWKDLLSEAGDLKARMNLGRLGECVPSRAGD